MVDDVLINKAASIERCVARVREEYEKDPATFATQLVARRVSKLRVTRARVFSVCQEVLPGPPSQA